MHLILTFLCLILIVVAHIEQSTIKGATQDTTSNFKEYHTKMNDLRGSNH